MRSLLVVLLLGPAIAGAAEPRQPLPSEPYAAGEYDVALVVKWRDGVRARTDGHGGVLLEGGGVPGGLSEVLAVHDVWFEPWLDLPEARLQALEDRALQRTGRAQPDLAGMHRVVVSSPDPASLERVAAALQALQDVEFVVGDAELVPPPGDLEPETPELVERQGWLDAGNGVDAWSAWDAGLLGEGIRISDCEYGWHHEHEDLVDGDLVPEPDQTPQPEVAARGWDHHGTAVAGELVGQHNGYGIRGLAPASTLGTYPEWTVEQGGRRGSAIANAIADSAPGDVVLLEMQTTGPDGRLCPAEVNSAVWTLVKNGTDAGVVVVGAAGNGTANLDSSAYESYRERGDSGALIVGAGASGTRARLGFSTYGSRVDVQGWGRNVFTTGYGNHARYGGDVLQTYTASFSGTSSASPMVAGSAALVQQAASVYVAEPLDSAEIRDLLASTGTPAPEGSGIGPLPDLGQALAEVELRYDVVPRIVSVDVASVDEGTPVELAATVELLPTHTGQWSWTVGGESFPGPNPTWTPVDDGEVAGELGIEDDWGRQDAMTFTIEVRNVAPDADPPAVDGPGTEGASATLTAVFDDPGAADTHVVEWTIDGEDAGQGATLEWTPADDATYTIGYTVTDDDGGSDQASLDLVIADVPATLVLEVPEQAPRKTDTALAVRVEDPGEDTWTVTWDLGDGSTATGTDVTHAWEERGPVEIVVEAVDEDGVTVRQTATLEIVRRGGCGCSATPVGGGLAWLAILGLVGLLRRRR